MNTVLNYYESYSSYFLQVNFNFKYIFSKQADAYGNRRKLVC